MLSSKSGMNVVDEEAVETQKSGCLSERAISGVRGRVLMSICKARAIPRNITFMMRTWAGRL
jgi:hypothetical protein